MPSVTLGNVSHTALITDTKTGEKTRYKSAHIEQSITMTGSLPDNIFSAMQAVINIWRHESDQPPAWVESDSEPLAAVLREHFGCGARPDDWEIIVTGEPKLELLEESTPTLEFAISDALSASEFKSNDIKDIKLDDDVGITPSG